MSREEYIKCAISKPQLFIRSVKKLDENIDDICKIFSIKKEKFIDCATKAPGIFLISPENISQNLGDVAKIFSKYNVSKEEYIEKIVLRQPNVLTYSFENMENKVNAIDFYIRNIKEKYKNISNKEIGKMLINKDFYKSKESWYLALLRSKMYKSGETPSMLTGANGLVQKFKEFLKSNNEYFEIDLYNHEMAPDFIEFVTNLSKDTTGKNYFSFNVVEK